MVDLAQAVGLLRAGELVAIPTETVYGLAADARAIHIHCSDGRPHVAGDVHLLPARQIDVHLWGRQVQQTPHARQLADRA